MSRIRIVKGKYVKITHGDHNMSTEGHIVSNAAGEIREKGNENGIIYNNFERKGSEVNDDFEIKLSLKKDKSYSTVVPFGILDFKGNYENAHFVFDYSLMLGNIDSLDFKILNEDGSTLYAVKNLPEVVVPSRQIPLLAQDLMKKKPKNNPLQPKKAWDWKSVFDPYNIMSGDYTKIGSYVIFWDGFDNNEIYDSTKFDNKKLKAVIVAKKNGKEKTKEVEFITNYSEVDWVDVKIDKKNKRIDTTLRVNLKDGGEEGLKCTTYKESQYTIAGEDNPFKNEKLMICDWDKVSKKALAHYKKEPLKKRSKSYSELKKIAFDGLAKYWGRNKTRIYGDGINIISDRYEVYIQSIDTEKKAMNSLPLIYNTNNEWMRSGNPGGSYSDNNLDDDLMDLFPDTKIIQRLSYNAGYIKYDWDSDPQNLEFWRYSTETGNISIAYDAISEFEETAAHELGHEFLQAYGGTVYSWQHKGSSYYLPQDTKPVKEEETLLDKITHWNNMESSGEYYPKSGEIDLMKYYNSRDRTGAFISGPDLNRTVAAEKDLFGIIWLTKIKIQ